MTRSRISHLVDPDDDDPMLSAINLVDVFLVAIVILIAGSVLRDRMRAEADLPLDWHEDFTLVTEPGTPDMQIVVKRGESIERFEATGSSTRGTGVAAGTAYRMRDGSLVYVPSTGSD